MLFWFADPGRAQISPVRLSVSKNEKKEQKTTYQDSSGYYRQRQINRTVSYSVEVRNFSSTALAGIVIKWAILYDPSHAEVRGGGGVSWNRADLKVLDGERTCSLQVGQRFAFDTDSVDLSSVHTGNSYTTRANQYGGDIRGYCVEVSTADGKLLASEIQPPDTKQQLDQVRAKDRKDQNSK
jgi:hypothetical protein